jgi:hypothetical protein
MPLVEEEEVLLVDQDVLVDLAAADQELVVVVVQVTNGRQMLLVSLVLPLVKVIMVEPIRTAQDHMAEVVVELVVVDLPLALVLEMVEPLFPIVLLVLL